MAGGVIGEAAVRIRPDTAGFEGAVRKGVSGPLARAAKLAVGALVAGGAVRVIAQQIGAAGALQTQLREVNSLTGLVGKAAERSFGQFSRGVQGLSRELGLAQQELTGGLYQALSAGIPRGNAIDFLRFAGKAAIAGVTDTKTAVDGLTTVINAFGLKASDVTKVSDSLFTAVKGGKTTFAELSDALFNVAPIAAAAGVGFRDVNAAIATLSAQGTPTAVATTQIRQAIQALIAPTTSAEKVLTPVFKKAGFESGQAALKALGFQKTLNLVRDASGGSSTKLQRLVGSVEGLQAVLGLTGRGGDKFTQQLKLQGDAAGATTKAFNEIEKSAGRSFTRATIAAKNFGLELGDAASGGVARLADAIETGLNNVSSSPGFRTGVSGISNQIADALTDPRTIASVEQFGQTAAAVLGAVGASARATAPAVQAVAKIFGEIASSPLGPGLLLTAAAYKVVGTAAQFAAGRVAAYKAAVVAGRVADVAATGAVREQVSAIGLVGPSSAKAAVGVSRIGSVVGGLGRGLLSLAGGPIGVAVLGVSALAAGAFLLAGREGNAAQAAQHFNDVLRDQASASREAAAGLASMRVVTGAIIEANANVTRSLDAQKTARAEVARIQAAPAADFGGQAAKAQALKGATNELAVATRAYNEARRQQGVIAAKALTTATAEQTRITAQIAKSRELAAATGITNRAQLAAVLATGLNRDAGLRYTQALDQQARGQAAIARNSQASSGILRQQAAAVDTSTAAGRRQVEALRAQARQAATTATVQRASALTTVTAAISANRQIVISDKTTATERAAAAGRVKFLGKLADQIRAQQAGATGAAKGVGKGIAAALATASGAVGAAAAKIGQAMGKGALKGVPPSRKAGTEAGKAVGQGAVSQAGTANAAGSAVGAALGSGVVSGINAQTGAVFAAAARLSAAAAAGARAGGKIKSPSKLMADEVGAPLADGIAAGMQSHEKGVAAAAADLMRAARGAAAAARSEAAGLSNAFGTQIRSSLLRLGARIKPAISQVLRESIVSAKQNLQSLADTVTGQLGQVIDAQLARQVKAIDTAFAAFEGTQSPLRAILDARGQAIDDRSRALDAISAADEERRLRDAISLAEAGQSRAQARLAAFQASLAKRTPAQQAALSPLAAEQQRQRLADLQRAALDPAHEARLELERFLVAQDQAQIDREQTDLDRSRTVAEQKAEIDRQAAQDSADARRTALEQGFGDLVADLNRGRIKIATFGERVRALMAANGVELSAIGADVGRSFVEQFNAQLTGLFSQAGALRNFIDGKPITVTVERPGLAQAGEAAAVRAALRTSANEAVARLRTQFQATGSAGKEKVTAGEQAQITALRKILDAIVNQPPGSVIEQLLVQAPGSDPQAIADRIIRQAAAAARR